MSIPLNKPTVVILCRAISPNESPMNTQYYLLAYSDLLLALRAQGAEAFFCTQNNYLGDGTFSQGYTISSRVPVADFQLVENIQADIVYNKADFSNVTDVPILNPRFVHDITSNKHETYRHFASYQPLSVFCSNPTEAIHAITKLTGDRVVIKKPTGNGGHGVAIIQREEFDAKNEQYPIIVQEFLDTSIGIPGLVDGVHDLRLKIGGGEVWSGTLRTPAEGELRANVAQGGTEQHLFAEEMPLDAIEIGHEIDAYFADYPRYYSVDLANTPSGWKLIELNSKPGLGAADMSPQSKHTTEQLARYLTRLATPNSQIQV